MSRRDRKFPDHPRGRYCTDLPCSRSYPGGGAGTATAFPSAAALRRSESGGPRVYSYVSVLAPGSQSEALAPVLRRPQVTSGLGSTAGFAFTLEFRPIPVGWNSCAWDCKVTPVHCACQEGNTIGCIPSNDGLDARLGPCFPHRSNRRALSGDAGRSVKRRNVCELADSGGIDYVWDISKKSVLRNTVQS